MSLVFFAGVYVIRRSMLAAGVVATGIFIASILSNTRFFRKAKLREDSKTDARADEVSEVTPSRVLDLELLGGNSPALCFLPGSEMRFCSVGQWLREYDSFPAKSFRLRRWSDTGEPIHIEVVGPAIEAEPSKGRLQSNYRFGEIEIFDASPETTQDDLDRTFIRRRKERQ